MELFYIDKEHLNNQILDEEESKHAVRVLRKKPGDHIWLTNGEGYFYQAVIEKTTKKNCFFTIINEQHFPKSPYTLTIAIAPPKNINRWEFFLEKATEIGVTEIIPIISRRSERTTLKIERSEKIIRSAVKQSKNPYKPLLHPLTAIKKLPDLLPENTRVFVGYCDEHTKKKATTSIKPTRHTVGIIGPEGDFTPEEIAYLIENVNAQPITLNPHRLRTETAGILFAAQMKLLTSLQDEK